MRLIRRHLEQKDAKAEAQSIPRPRANKYPKYFSSPLRARKTRQQFVEAMAEYAKFSVGRLHLFGRVGPQEEFRDGVQELHRHLARRAGKIHSAQRQAVDADAAGGQLCLGDPGSSQSANSDTYAARLNSVLIVLAYHSLPRVVRNPSLLSFSAITLNVSPASRRSLITRTTSGAAIVLVAAAIRPVLICLFVREVPGGDISKHCKMSDPVCRVRAHTLIADVPREMHQSNRIGGHQQQDD